MFNSYVSLPEGREKGLECNRDHMGLQVPTCCPCRILPLRRVPRMEKPYTEQQAIEEMLQHTIPQDGWSLTQSWPRSWKVNDTHHKAINTKVELYKPVWVYIECMPYRKFGAQIVVFSVLKIRGRWNMQFKSDATRCPWYQNSLCSILVRECQEMFRLEK